MNKFVLLTIAALAGIVLFSSLTPPRADAQQPDWVEVFIDLPTRPSAFDRAALRSFGGDERHEFRTSNTIAVRMPANVVSRLTQYGRFRNVRPVPTAVALEDTLDWGVDRIEAEHVWGSGENAVNVASGGNAGAGVKVAVIDTGIDSSHPDLSANVAGGWNFVANNSNFFDDHGHGTHVSGTIAARDNGSGVIGVAPEATLYGLKVLDSSGSGSYSDIIAAIEWASGLNGGTKVDVINMSLGCYYASYPPACDDQALHNAVDAAYAAGVVVVAAAGNSGSGNDTVGYPAQYDSVIAVAATTSSDSRASFSSTGPDVELAAPGNGILSTLPGNSYASWSGTSMATPHVAGAAALVRAANPGMSAADVRARLRDTAIDLGSSGRDSSYGYGLIQADLAAEPQQGGGGDPPPPSSSGEFLNCSAQLAASGGDGNGYQGSAANACADGGGYATDDNSGNGSSTSCGSSNRDRHVFYNYNAGIESGAAVQGIEVRLDAWVDATSFWWSTYTSQICVELSWDGGATWTSAKQTPALTTSETTYILGSSSDTWGHDWTAAQLSNSNLRVRLTDTSNSTSRDFRLDWVTVRVTSSEVEPVQDTTPPEVNSVSPADNAAAVPVDTAISATFSEDIDASTVNGSTFSVETAGGSPIAGSVSVSGDTATFTPTGDLPGATGIVVTLDSAIADPAGNSLGSDYSWDFTTVETVPPTVSFTSPQDGATDVAVNANVVATFSENIDNTTVTSSTFTLTGPNGNVPGARSVVGNVVTLNPNANLASETEYTATLTTGVTDLAGNHLTSVYTWTFTTADVVPPTVSVTSPLNNAKDVAVDSNVSATFSEDIDNATVTSSTFTLTGPNGNVPGARSVIGNLVVLNPTADLESEAVYTATLTTGVSDLAGNHLASTYSWTFTTADVIAPTVESTSPQDDATGVAVDAEVSATFSEAMDPDTLDETSFTLSGPGNTPVAGSVAYDDGDDSVTFTPTSPLAENTLYTATLSTGVTDEAGNPLASAYEWTFTTAADEVAPLVTSVLPADDATGVPVGDNLTATFNEALNPGTLAGSFEVIPDGGSAVPGLVTYNDVTNVVTFNPAADLQGETLYTARLTTAIQDLAGNPLAGAYEWTFTTADITPPTVESTSPASDATGVAVGSNVSATFSEDIDNTTVTNSSFTLVGPSGAIAGSRSVVGGTVTFNPSGNLSLGTTYTATLTTNVKDLAGNNLAAQYQWTFTTEADTAAPTVTSVSPAANASGVATGTVITATFSEAVAPATLSGNFQVRLPNNSLVAGSVSYNAGTRTATFTPSSALANSTTYTVTLTTGIEDMSGNPLSGNQGNGSYVWSFTTASNVAACTAPVIVSSSDTNGWNGSVSFSWQAVPGATQYTILRGNWWGTSWTVAGTTSGTSFSGSDPWYDPDYRVYVSGGSCAGIPGPYTQLDP